MTRAKKEIPFETSRRTFLRRGAVLISALGLGSGLSSGVMDAIVRRGKRDFGSALAAGSGVVDFSIEICMRAGFQTSCLFPAAGHTRTIGNGTDERYGPDKLNFYWTPAAIQSANAGNGRSLHLAAVDGNGAFGANPLATFADRIAVSEAVSDGTGTFSHTASWRQRFPNAQAPAPSVMHAAHAPADVPVRGVSWGTLPQNAGGIEHFNRDLPALQASVQNHNAFTGLYKDLPLPFTHEELRRVVGAFDDSGALNNPGVQQKLDQLFRNRTTLPGAGGEAVEVLNAGRSLSTLSIDLSIDSNPAPYVPSNAITGDINVMRSQFGYDDFFMNLGGVEIGKAMMHIYRAMALGVLRTAVINLDSSDWHSDRPNTDNATLAAKQGLWATVLTRGLASFLDFAAATDNPFNSGSIADSLAISMGSEFCRTPFNNLGVDNGDGFAQSLIFMGSRVKGGSLGDIDTRSTPLAQDTGGTFYGESRIQSFDPVTGALAPTGQRMSPGSVWKTHMAIMGITESAYSSYAVDGAIIPALVND